MIEPHDFSTSERRNRDEVLSEASVLTNGTVATSPLFIVDGFLLYYQQLFTASDRNDLSQVLECVASAVTAKFNNMLCMPFKDEEVHQALFQMPTKKALEIDGLCTLFFQKYWDTIRREIVKEVLHRPRIRQRYLYD